MDAFDWERLIRALPGSHITPTEALVAYALRTFADADGSRCRPGRARLAAATKLHPVTVTKALGRLEGKGLIRGRQFGGSRGTSRGYATLYELTQPPEAFLRSSGLLTYRLPGDEDQAADDPAPAAAGGLAIARMFAPVR